MCTYIKYYASVNIKLHLPSICPYVCLIQVWLQGRGIWIWPNYSTYLSSANLLTPLWIPLSKSLIYIKKHQWLKLIYLWNPAGRVNCGNPDAPVGLCHEIRGIIHHTWLQVQWVHMTLKPFTARVNACIFAFTVNQWLRGFGVERQDNVKTFYSTQCIVSASVSQPGALGPLRGYRNPSRGLQDREFIHIIVKLLYPL